MTDISCQFSSLDGRDCHRKSILSELAWLDAELSQNTGDWRIDIMCFAFTDGEIADELVMLAATHAHLQIRVLADWSQGAPNGPAVIRDLISCELPNLDIRYKIDLPYYWDADQSAIRWGYHSSHGMLHHKTMMISRDGKPQKLWLGSYNWSVRAAGAYENSIVLKRSARNGELMLGFDAEFAAIWSDSQISVDAEGAEALIARAQTCLSQGGSMHNLEDLAEITGAPIPISTIEGTNRQVQLTRQVAFSGRRVTDLQARRGFATRNHARKINLLRSAGQRRAAPLTLNTLGLEMIRAVPAGDTILVALYALSPQVPEYAALIEAARRGCQVSVLLDGQIGAETMAHLQQVSVSENLPLKIRVAGRRMHQKYIVAPRQNMVLTGTANMTRDATSRHAEHRLLLRDVPQVADRFARDFKRIWKRLNRQAA